jgi:hypothetical protein
MFSVQKAADPYNSGMSDVLDWAVEPVRYEFFAQLPRPLAVMLACDVAALAPQPPLGAAAIDAARRWIMGAVSPQEVRIAACAAAVAARNTADAAYAAAAAAHTVHTSSSYLAYSASAVCEAVCRCAEQGGLDLQTVGYAAQSRRVEFLRQAMQEDHPQMLIAAWHDDPAARAVLWDAMLDAGYTPQPTHMRDVSTAVEDQAREEVSRRFLSDGLRAARNFFTSFRRS